MLKKEQKIMESIIKIEHREVIKNIKETLEKFDMVLMIKDGSGVSENLTRDICNSQALNETSKRVLILSGVDISDTENHSYYFRRIYRREQEIIEQIYSMYEFSDRFKIISESQQYGSILNYVKSGLLTMEEVFRALLN